MSKKPTVFDPEYGCQTIFERKVIRYLERLTEAFEDIAEYLQEKKKP